MIRAEFGIKCGVTKRGIAIVTVRTLQEALKELLKDDEKVSKYEARVLREMIMGDLFVSAAEKKFLEEAIETNKFDDQALSILRELL